MSMNNTSKYSKKNITYLLIAVFSIGTIVGINQITNANAITNATSTISANDLNKVFNCITQKVNNSTKFKLADAFVCYDNVLKGSLKYASLPFQNPDLSHLNNTKTVSAVTTTAKDTGINSAAGKTHNADTATKSGTKSADWKTPNRNQVNLHLANTLTDDKVTNLQALKQPHGIDIFLNLLETPQGASGTKSAAGKTHNADTATKSASKTKTPNGNEVSQDVSNPPKNNKKIIAPSNSNDKSKNSISPLNPSQNSFDPFVPVSDSPTTLKHATSIPHKPTPSFESFSLPFTALVP